MIIEKMIYIDAFIVIATVCVAVDIVIRGTYTVFEFFCLVFAIVCSVVAIVTAIGLRNFAKEDAAYLAQFEEEE